MKACVAHVMQVDTSFYHSEIILLYVHTQNKHLLHYYYCTLST